MHMRYMGLTCAHGFAFEATIHSWSAVRVQNHGGHETSRDMATPVYINGELKTRLLEYQNNRNRHIKIKKLLLHELSQKRKSLRKIALSNGEYDPRRATTPLLPESSIDPTTFVRQQREEQQYHKKHITRMKKMEQELINAEKSTKLIRTLNESKSRVNNLLNALVGTEEKDNDNSNTSLDLASQNIGALALVQSVEAFDDESEKRKRKVLEKEIAEREKEKEKLMKELILVAGTINSNNEITGENEDAIHVQQPPVREVIKPLGPTINLERKVEEAAAKAFLWKQKITPFTSKMLHFARGAYDAGEKQLNQAEEVIHKLTVKLDDEKAKYLDLQKNTSRYNREIKSLKGTREKLTQRISVLQNEVQNAAAKEKAALERMKAEQAHLKQELKALQYNILHKEQKLQEEEEKNKALTHDRDALLDESAKLKAKHKKDEMKILQLGSELKTIHTKMDGERKNWQLTRDRLNVTIQTLNKEKQDAIDNCNTLKQKMEDEKSKSEKEIAALTATIRTTKIDLEQAEDALEKTLGENQNLLEQVDALRSELDLANNRVREFEGQISSNASNTESLKHQVTDLMKEKVKLESQLKLADEKISKFDIRQKIKRTFGTQTEDEAKDGTIDEKVTEKHSIATQTENVHNVHMSQTKASDKSPTKKSDNFEKGENPRIQELLQEIKILKSKLRVESTRRESSNLNQQQIKQMQLDDFEKYDNEIEKWSDNESFDSHTTSQKPSELLGVLMQKVDDDDITKAKFSIKVSTATQTEHVKAPSVDHVNNVLPAAVAPKLDLLAAKQHENDLKDTKSTKSSGVTTIRELMATQMASNYARAKSINEAVISNIADKHIKKSKLDKVLKLVLQKRIVRKLQLSLAWEKWSRHRHLRMDADIISNRTATMIQYQECDPVEHTKSQRVENSEPAMFAQSHSQKFSREKLSPHFNFDVRHGKMVYHGPKKLEFDYGDKMKEMSKLLLEYQYSSCQNELFLLLKILHFVRNVSKALHHLQETKNELVDPVDHNLFYECSTWMDHIESSIPILKKEKDKLEIQNQHDIIHFIMRKNYKIRQLYTRYNDKEDTDDSVKRMVGPSNMSDPTKELRNQKHLVNMESYVEMTPSVENLKQAVTVFKDTPPVKSSSKRQYLRKRYNLHNKTLKKITPSAKANNNPKKRQKSEMQRKMDSHNKSKIHSDQNQLFLTATECNNDIGMTKSLQNAVSLPNICNNNVNLCMDADKDMRANLRRDENQLQKSVAAASSGGEFTLDNTISLDEAFQIPSLNRTRKTLELERIERMKKGRHKLSRNREHSRSKVRSRLGNWTPYTPAEDPLNDKSLALQMSEN